MSDTLDAQSRARLANARAASPDRAGRVAHADALIEGIKALRRGEGGEFDNGYDAALNAVLRLVDAALLTASPDRAGLLRLAARMVRLEGGCEKGHRAGQWHMHEEPYHRQGRELALAATRDSEGRGLDAAMAFLRRRLVGSPPNVDGEDVYFASLLDEAEAVGRAARLRESGS